MSSLVGNFTFVRVPVEVSSKVEVITASKSGGLPDDELRKHAENYFDNKSIDIASQQVAIGEQLRKGGMDENAVASALSKFSDKMGGQIEIIVLALPTRQNNFQSVSIYCDGNSSFRTTGDGANQINMRATELAHACGHRDVAIMGECFIGRAHDDERVEWERVNFTEADLATNSPWVAITALQNVGKDTSSWSTAGIAKNYLDQKMM